MLNKIDIHSDIKDLIKLFYRAEKANKENAARHVQKKQIDSQPTRERLSEREFVRAFGTKVAKVRYSNRADFVGLTVLGKQQGFTITNDQHGGRKIRLIDIDAQGVSHVTHRFLPVKSNESVSNLQRGLLKWVR